LKPRSAAHLPLLNGSHVTSDALIETTATAVAELYADLDFGDYVGVLLLPISGDAPEDVAPMALGLYGGEVTPDVEPDHAHEELDSPYVPPSVSQELVDRAAQEPEGYLVMEHFWLVLADRLHSRLGIPVLVWEITVSIAEQLERQGGATASPHPEIDTAVSQRIDQRRTAAVWYDPDQFGLVGSAGPSSAPVPVDLNTRLSADPEVRAGLLPPGAARVSLQDRQRQWHHARIGENAWLVVLPQRGGSRDPELRYHDSEGTPFQLEHGTNGLPALWPEQAPDKPKLGLTGPNVVSYRANGWTVAVTSEMSFPQAPSKPVPGSVLGRNHGFGLRSVDDGWEAVALCGTFTVTVAGSGVPPTRFDLREINAE